MTLLLESRLQDSIVVSLLTADSCDMWDKYVHGAEGGLPLHLSGWRDVMQKTYGYETRYLQAICGERLVGVLPLFLVPSRLTGKRAMTMPGGLCADNDQAAQSLLDAGMNSIAGSGIDRMLLQDSRVRWQDRFHTESQHVYWLVNLEATEEELWKNLDGNIRRQVRKAKRNNLKTEISRDGSQLDSFYEIFSLFTHQAGTPVFAKTFIQNVVEVFPGGYNIFIVRNEGQPIAGYFQLEMGDTVYGMWGAALPATRNLRPAYLALWEIMRDAVSNGFRFLDMGRSPAASNASKFKGQWGGISAPIYQTIIMNNEHLRSNNMSSQVQSGRRFQLFMQVWPRLPLSLTRYLGPKLRWHMPFA